MTSGTMISGRHRLPRLSPGLDRALEDRARLHFRDFRIADRKPHAAEAEHGIELRAARPNARAACPRSRFIALATSSISSSVFGRNSCSGGSSRRIVTGRPVMISNSSAKSWRCIGSSLASAARRPCLVSARIISRTATMRSPSKNMCSVRQRPMPSAPNERATRASAARLGVGAHLHAPDRVGPAHEGGEIAGHLRLHHRRRALHHLARAAVDGEDVALLQRHAARGHRLRRHNRCGSCWRRRRRACPCRARRRPRARSCRRAW